MAFAAVVALLAGLAAAQDAPDGASIYQNQCATCHGESGGGGVGPALAGNEALGNTAEAIRQVLHGGGGMPAFADQLSNAQIAAVLTHIRTAWGNDFGPVEPSRVAEIRQGDGGAAPGEEAGGGPDQPAEEQAAEQPDEQPAGQAGEEQAEQPDERAEQPDEQAAEGAVQPEGEPADRALDQAQGQEAGEAADRDEPDAITPGPDPVLTEGFGTLALVVRPDEARVEIAGPAGFETRTGAGGEIFLEELPPGAYRVTVTIGEERYVQTADLSRGGRIEMLFDLGAGGG